MTDPSRGDAGEYDELAEVVAREHADRLVAHRRLRAWLMSATASAALIVLALTVVSLPDGQRHQSRSPEPGLSAPPLDLPLLHIDGRDQVSQLLSGVQVLSGIVLPTGWSSTMVTATNVESRTDPFHWSTLWIAKDQAADGPRVIAAALTGQGWQRCAGGGVRSECWQLGMYQLILTWGPGEGCPSQGPCSRAGVVLYITSPPTSPVAFVPKPSTAFAA
jgi:hypothetical protein